MTWLIKAIPGTVMQVDKNHVVLKLTLPHDTANVSLPRPLFDEKLAIFGASVFLELIEEEGFKKFSVRERKIEKSPIPDDLINFVKWANSV